MADLRKRLQVEKENCRVLLFGNDAMCGGVLRTLNRNRRFGSGTVSVGRHKIDDGIKPRKKFVASSWIFLTCAWPDPKSGTG